eukprot:96686-Hanusia_phi.AAC.1
MVTLLNGLTWWWGGHRFGGKETMRRWEWLAVAVAIMVGEGRGGEAFLPSPASPFLPLVNSMQKASQLSVARLRKSTLSLAAGRGRKGSRLPSMKALEDEEWQDLAEKLADPFVSPFEKPMILAELARRREQVSQTVSDVLGGRRAQEALLGSRGRKQLKAARAVARQVTEDIVPDARKQAEELLQEVRDKGVGSLAGEIQNRILVAIDDATVEGMLKVPEAGSVEDIMAEVRNIFSETPEGLETPSYSVVRSSSEYEIRDYSPMLVASKAMSAERQEDGNAFNELASFLFGKNDRKEAMSMTTPVITAVDGEGRTRSMSFVIPSKYDLDSVPKPVGLSAVRMQQMEDSRVAAREFPGFATPAEVGGWGWRELRVVRQRDALLAALEEDGVTVEADEVVGRHMADDVVYNPPYTLPTFRRNEVFVRVLKEGAREEGKVDVVEKKEEVKELVR